MSRKNSKKIEEAVEKAIPEVAQEMQQRPLVPGYEQICNFCIYKDFYTTFKNSTMQSDALQKQQTLLQNLQRQVENSMKEIERLQNLNKDNDGKKENPVE